MTTDARARLRAQLIIDEDLRLKPYRDTVGKLSIGVGRNLDDVGISRIEAMYLCENDIDRTVRDLVSAFPWFGGMDPVRQTALVNMAFNMGVGNSKKGLRTFVNSLAALGREDYIAAADGIRRSVYARQVGARAERVARLIETGEFPPFV